ncbi:hypothetical protein INS49_003336 [Diaporthe citri]|uniref:uncharacterized protein n=1 Tax=Diaporthe citri TaxID=83186 RepID=UPI001C7E5463|nr:uncharacterized protein INS49_003336 [Diaporthe citri]KAG6355374.1 hypothetical protein INS49_003336 [Diaporthe citri]
MQLRHPRYEFVVDASPWPPASHPPDWVNEPDDYTIPIVVISSFYVVGILVGCLILRAVSYPAGPGEARWVPAWARRDACLTPLFFALPAFSWPLLPAVAVLTVIGFFLRALAGGLWNIVGSSTSCCGIPLPRRRSGGAAAAADAGASSDPDLEMGPVDACGEHPVGGVQLDGGADDSDALAGVRRAGSEESERPPSYTSVPPDEDDGGEADGLLAKNDK